MAIIEGNSVEERTKREAIDELLLKLCNLARENDQAMHRLRGILLSAPSEGQSDGQHPSRPGWLGEITDALELAIEYLASTATVLKEVSQQVAVQTPSAEAPRK